VRVPTTTCGFVLAAFASGGRGAGRPKTFVGQVMRAARKAGHTGPGFGRSARGSRSRFGRGRGAALALSLHRRDVASWS